MPDAQNQSMLIRPFHAADEENVVEVWRACGLLRPVNNPYKDIQRKMNVNSELFLVGVLDGKIVSAIMGGYDGHRGAVYYVGVHPDHQRKGFGRAIMLELERRLSAMGCPKFNLIVRGENKKVVEFYRSIGFEVEPNLQLGKRLESDERSPQIPASISNDEVFLQQFESKTWPLAQWHHRQHIKVAYLYLRKYPFDQAMGKIRAGIKSYNAAHNIPEAPDRGYHETMTQAWMRLVDFILHQYGPAETADHFFDAHPELGQFKTLRFFYSRKLFMSAEAKRNFVEPDITQLPRTTNS